LVSGYPESDYKNYLMNITRDIKMKENI